MLVSVFTTILVLGGTQPDVTVMPGFKLSVRDCQDMVNRFSGKPPVLTDPVTGRPVIMTFYKCVPADPEREIRDYQGAIDTGAAN